MEYYIMEKAEQLYREAMAKHGLANCVSPMIKDIVFMVVEKMEKEAEKEITQLQDQIRLQVMDCSEGCPPSDK